MVDEINLTEVWDDLINKEFRLTTVEETLSHRALDGEPTRACTIGDLDEAEDSVATKLVAPEKMVHGLTREPRSSGPASFRKPISEYKVIQNVTPLLEDQS